MYLVLFGQSNCILLFIAEFLSFFKWLLISLEQYYELFFIFVFCTTSSTYTYFCLYLQVTHDQVVNILS